MKTIDIICPLYNAAVFIAPLHASLLNQKNVKIANIHYVLTESSDGTEDYLKENNISYKKIKKNEFSHSLTREKEAMKSTADILVFISQDAIITDDLWLHKLTKDIDGKEIVATICRLRI